MDMRGPEDIPGQGRAGHVTDMTPPHGTPVVPEKSTESITPSSKPNRGERWTRGQKAGAGLGVAALVAGGIALLRGPGNNEGATDSKKEPTATTLVAPASADTSVPTSVTVEAPVLTPEQQEQATVDKILRDGGYSEMVGQKPTFRKEIETNNSITHIVSFMPDELFPEKAFDQVSAQANIELTENAAQEKTQFTWDEFDDRPAVTRSYTTRINGKRVDYVFLAAGDSPTPSKLESSKGNFPALAAYLKEDRSVFWTIGNSSFLIWRGDDSFKYILPSENPGDTTPIRRRIAAGLLAENFVRIGTLFPYNYNDFEGAKAAFYQIAGAAQYDIPYEAVIGRLGTQVAPNYPVYYPRDNKSLRDLYKLASQISPTISDN